MMLDRFKKSAGMLDLYRKRLRFDFKTDNSLGYQTKGPLFAFALPLRKTWRCRYLKASIELLLQGSLHEPIMC